MKFEPLIDRFNRRIGSVRISITDRCNLRCQYCMPEEGIKWQEKSQILSFEEIIRLVGIFYDQGVHNFRLTGGEPTIRDHLPKLIHKITSKFPDIELSLTTNGIKLVELSEDLKNAGLNRINVSLDTLDHDKFEFMTRRKTLSHVIEGIKTALNLGFDEIKINAVSIKHFNNDYENLKSFIDFSEEFGLEVRFIEFMPFTGMGWKTGEFVSSVELRDIIAAHEKMIPLDLVNISSTSRTWSLREGKARIGFVSSVSESFCSSCNRVRITADGNFRPCLHNSREYPLRDLIRSGATDLDLLQVIKLGLNEKWKEHPDFLSLAYLPPIDDREMIRIGG